MTGLAQAMEDLLWLHEHDAGHGCEAVITERRRQVEKLGYDAAHDAGHPPGQLVTRAGMEAIMCAYMIQHDVAGRDDSIPELAKAAALVAAEIDRLEDR